MTDEEILKRAISKAVKNGWKSEFPWLKPSFTKGELVGNHYMTWVFSKDFARALGYTLQELGKRCDEGKEPLKFIKKFI